MERITVERVRAAYAKTGLRPVRGTYDDGSGGTCAVGAVALAETGQHMPNAYVLGFPIGYISDFTRGFDGLPPHLDANPEYYADGQSAAKAMGL